MKWGWTTKEGKNDSFAIPGEKDVENSTQDICLPVRAFIKAYKQFNDYRTM